MHKKVLTVFFLFILIIFCQSGQQFAQNKMKAPTISREMESEENYGAGKNIIINFYQKNISTISGNNNCMMYPSCSQYSKLAFDKYPPLIAFIKTCDRLIRCGQELNYYPRILIGGKTCWYDPLK